MLSCRHRFRAGFLPGRSWAPSPAGIMQLAWCWTNLMRLRYRRDGSIWVKAPFVRGLPISYTEPQESKVSVRNAKQRHPAAFPTEPPLGIAHEYPENGREPCRER